MLAAVDHERPVDEHGFDARRVTVRAVVGRAVGDAGRVEDHDVGEIALLQPAAAAELQILGGQGGKAPDGLLQRDNFLLADVTPEHPRKAP